MNGIKITPGMIKTGTTVIAWLALLGLFIFRSGGTATVTMADVGENKIKIEKMEDKINDHQENYAGFQAMIKTDVGYIKAEITKIHTKLDKIANGH